MTLSINNYVNCEGFDILGTNIANTPIGLAVVMAIIPVSTFTTADILYI